MGSIPCHTLGGMANHSALLLAALGFPGHVFLLFGNGSSGMLLLCSLIAETPGSA
jgi:hypothetical protein